MPSQGESLARLLHLALVAGWLASVGVGPAPVAADDSSEEKFESRSLQYRTALHHDPLLDSALESLVDLYREAERVDELIGLYRSHAEQYPDDAGAKTVLIRILRKVDRSGADELIASAAPRHPEFAPLQYLLFRFLEEKGDDRAVDVLSRAIELESNPARRSAWLEELLELSDDEKARASARKHLEEILALKGQSAASLLSLARLMQRHLFWELSVAALNEAKSAGLATADQVEADVLIAGARAELGNREAAGRLLDALLGRLAPDHWRRREIMSLRIGVLASEEERAAMEERLRKAWEKNRENESAALDYAEFLVAGERQGDAVDVLVESAARLPESGVIEARALELLESINDPAAYERFLERRLEAQPERSDLRFRLVKVHYALGKDGDAEQDFKAVVAGLDPDEASERILELQRYLRRIDRIGAAAAYLERYVRNHPAELDVARELAEVHVKGGDRAAVERLVSRLDAKAASRENVLDLAEFLVAERFFASARTLLDARLKQDPEQIELGLLLVEVLGEVGDEAGANRLIASLREMADTPERYSRWLEAAVTACGKLETVDEFFDRERNRFSFSDGEWPEVKVEKFIILCEAGRQRLFTDRVAEAIRKQLARGGFDSKLRVRLRRLLVSVLEDDPGAAGEVEEQLNLLSSEDPANAAEYDLRRAVAYHHNQRIDLAQELLVDVDPAEVDSAPLVREAADILIEYDFLDEAEAALTVVNELAPEDVFSWEKRLAVLAATRAEAEFRSVVRRLRSGEAGVELREASRQALENHLVNSYWRSVSRLIAGEDGRGVEEALPLLASVDREIRSPQGRAWTEWTRAHVLFRSGREREAGEAIERFRQLVDRHELASVTFPDGLTLSVDAAERFATAEAGERSSPEGVAGRFLLGEPTMQWAFEVDAGARIVRFVRSGERILALDDRGTVYAIDLDSGKLLWREFFGGGASGAARPRPRIFLDLPVSRAEGPAPDELPAVAKRARPIAATDEAFFLLLEDHVRAYASADGELLWSAPVDTPSPAPRQANGSGASAETRLVAHGGRLFAFHPASGLLLAIDAETGKWLWQNRIDGGEGAGAPEGRLFSLNAGLDAADGLVFAYGRRAAVLDAATGATVWRFDGEPGSRFPLVLRKDRGEGADGNSEKPTAAKVVSRPSGKTSWQAGRGEEAPARRFLDFVGSEATGVLPLTGPLEGEASLVGPAMHWARARLSSGTPALGAMGDGHLWLMREGRLRRVSARAPVASKELPAEGIFIGETGNHAWLLDDGYLRHVDFHRDRVSRLQVSDVGGVASLRAELVGNQLVVSGGIGFKLVNALTGQVIGQGVWPDPMREHLRRRAPELDRPGNPSSAWQGRIRRRGPGQPAYCLPVGSVVTRNRFVTIFGERVLACVGAGEPRGENPQ